MGRSRVVAGDGERWREADVGGSRQKSGSGDSDGRRPWRRCCPGATAGGNNGKYKGEFAERGKGRGSGNHYGRDGTQQQGQRVSRGTATEGDSDTRRAMERLSAAIERASTGSEVMQAAGRLLVEAVQVGDMEGARQQVAEAAAVLGWTGAEATIMGVAQQVL